MIVHERPSGLRSRRQGLVRIPPSNVFRSFRAADTASVDPVGEPEQQPATEQEGGQLERV
jgi:hypothetical protein